MHPPDTTRNAFDGKSQLIELVHVIMEHTIPTYLIMDIRLFGATELCQRHS